MSIKVKFFVILLPVIGLIAQSFLEVLVPQAQLADLHSEWGPHETLQSIVMAIVMVLSFRLLLMPQVRARKWIFAWVWVAFLGSIYVSGEEISWGQHVFNWNTPEYWQALNDQGETNFHNTSSWFDQKPRLVLEIGVLIGGIIIPVLRRFKVKLPEKFSLIYPTDHVFTTALIVLIVTIISKIGGIMERPSEVEELYIYYFILIYLVDFRARMKTLS